MFERFSSDARAAVARSQDEARARKAAQIQPVHVLLALATDPGPGGQVLRDAGADHDALAAAVSRVGGPLDAEALAAVGIDLDQVRAATEAAFGPGALDAGRRSPAGHIPFSDAAKRSLGHTLRTAIRDGVNSMDSGHLLAGVLLVGDPAVVRVLRQVGADPGDLLARLPGRGAA